ncbi:Transaldolase [Lachnellula hyalina]|uniref:Transaldolase n=1 Tax=Lachnellula hyalina TaxID=1316788 RepID=A0A8H8QXQ7_9HELO|nr:Transaldolase [Lachnellula hyalina]TVY24778.1 Transaldolase [Lachnellula hyalina]
MVSARPNALQAMQNSGTVLIADTADFQQIARFRPSEGTTNPSLLLLAAKETAYSGLISQTSAYLKSLDNAQGCEELAVEYLAVLFGTEIYKLTGRVSTEVDVIYSFDTAQTVAAALRIIQLYATQGVPKEAVRIKISATWEGIAAGKILQEQHGISVLITIVFGLVQAITAAEAGVDCIAPYIGRISDWHKAHGSSQGTDGGVETVTQMQNYLRKYSYKTKVMGASFRSTAQVKALAGVDLLTISPTILEALEKETEDVPIMLTEQTGGLAHLHYIPWNSINIYTAKSCVAQQVSYLNNEAAFRWAFNKDACAVEKSAEAMRKFAEDTERLKELLRGLS